MLNLPLYASALILAIIFQTNGGQYIGFPGLVYDEVLLDVIVLLIPIFVASVEFLMPPT